MNQVGVRSARINVKPLINLVALLAFFWMPAPKLCQPAAVSANLEDQFCSPDLPEKSTWESSQGVLLDAAYDGVPRSLSNAPKPWDTTDNVRVIRLTLASMGPRAPPIFA